MPALAFAAAGAAVVVSDVAADGGLLIRTSSAISRPLMPREVDGEYHERANAKHRARQVSKLVSKTK
jgi:hypothetical protein